MNRSALFFFAFVMICCIDWISCENCNANWQNHPNYDISAERVYYVACVEEIWDYAPTGMNLITGEPITETSPAGYWLFGNGVNRIGSTYIKTIYREFTDNCFGEQKNLGLKWAHLGAVGPVIRACVGETIQIFYKNLCSIPSSMHPHGMRYDKLSEGAPYQDGSHEGDIIQPGDGWIYKWEARPGTVDKGASSKMWLYHSHVDEIKDIHSGLIGAIIITEQGKERGPDDLMPIDVGREFVTFFIMYNENESLMFGKNVNKFLKSDFADFEDTDFSLSNEMFSINGYLFGNLNNLNCMGGESVRWYTASFGDEEDGPHSPHWHGNIAITPFGDNTDAVVLIPGTTSTVTMAMDAFGIWLYHCHVFEHIEAGMITTYTCLQGNGGGNGEGNGEGDADGEDNGDGEDNADDNNDDDIDDEDYDEDYDDEEVDDDDDDDDDDDSAYETTTDRFGAWRNK